LSLDESAGFFFILVLRWIREFGVAFRDLDKACKQQQKDYAAYWMRMTARFL
jgi:hypothetical protein